MAYPNIYETDPSKFPNYGSGIIPSARGVFGALAGKTGNTMLSLMTTPEKYAESETAARNVSESMSAAAKAVPESITVASKPVSQILKEAAIATAAKQAVQAQSTVAPQPVAVPVANQGMSWAKAAQDAVKGFGVTPKTQAAPSMDERGLVKDEQGRWVPSEALRAGVEANYQSGLALRDVAQRDTSNLADRRDRDFGIQEQLQREQQLERQAQLNFDANIGWALNNPLAPGAKALLTQLNSGHRQIGAVPHSAESMQKLVSGQEAATIAVEGAKATRSKVAADVKNIEASVKAKDAEIGELPSLRSLREAQTKQTLAEAGLAAEKTRLYPDTVMQSQKAAETKAIGMTVSKLQDNIFKLRQKLASAALPAEKEAYSKLISEQSTLLEKAMQQ